jgi:hypothetical protein
MYGDLLPNKILVSLVKLNIWEIFVTCFMSADWAKARETIGVVSASRSIT